MSGLVLLTIANLLDNVHKWIHSAVSPMPFVSLRSASVSKYGQWKFVLLYTGFTSEDVHLNLLD